jgi:hypothetical protein
MPPRCYFGYFDGWQFTVKLVSATLLAADADRNAAARTQALAVSRIGPV